MQRSISTLIKVKVRHDHTTKIEAWQQSRCNETKINFKVLNILQRNIYYHNNKCEQPSEVHRSKIFINIVFEI